MLMIPLELGDRGDLVTVNLFTSFSPISVLGGKIVKSLVCIGWSFIHRHS